MTTLAAALPRLLPLAIDWVQSQEIQVLATGRRLTDIEAKLAVAVSVRHPDHIRLKFFTEIPQPDNPELRALGIQTDCSGPTSVASPSDTAFTFGRGMPQTG